jgi:hypothetical protein
LREKRELKKSNTNKRNYLFTAIAVAAFLFAGYIQAMAQSQQRIYKPGDVLKDGSGYAYKIIRCDGAGEWDECEYQAYSNGKPTGASGQKMTIRNLGGMEQRMMDAKKREAKLSGQMPDSNDDQVTPTPSAPQNKPTVAAAAPKNKQTTGGKIAGVDGKWKVGDKLEAYYRSVWYRAEIVGVQDDKYKVHYEGYPASDDGWVDESRMRPLGGYQITAECEYDLPGDNSPSARASEQLFKKEIWQRYFSLSQAGGNLSVNSPLETGVAFLVFEMNPSFKNTVGNLPGQGASRVNNGAPVGATIYPVKTKFVVCKKYKDGVSRFMHDETMHCFKNKEGEWTCDGAGVPKITPID